MSDPMNDYPAGEPGPRPAEYEECHNTAAECNLGSCRQHSVSGAFAERLSDIGDGCRQAVCPRCGGRGVVLRSLPMRDEYPQTFTLASGLVVTITRGEP